MSTYPAPMGPSFPTPSEKPSKRSNTAVIVLLATVATLMVVMLMTGIVSVFTKGDSNPPPATSTSTYDAPPSTQDDDIVSSDDNPYPEPSSAAYTAVYDAWDGLTYDEQDLMCSTWADMDDDEFAVFFYDTWEGPGGAEALDTFNWMYWEECT